ncbi:uncharacterized protein LTHEOB_12963 [Lasiodiplodia theobromae]|uniref:uncharacterized protein n=1 Tax=Lasiodiplodia theobromae TaxID=45133 RepID=UPI0015C3F28B|nr:uncharacterized protein LTHEOB_12963 [Lasiodiplodia theobromae]KAF4534597.1 hypothetical protein LTHEOB_12963 [Lasiodiplodia theobromae]
MADDDLAENWLISEPVVTQWYDREERRLRYLGFASPPNWRSHLTLNLGLDISESKREVLFWFRLPIRVKSKTSKRPTKFYVYFIVELDMFDVDGEDQGLCFSQQSTVPPAVQFAFKGSSICQSDDELVRLRFNLKKPGVVVMPKADDGPFEPSAVNQEVLLALKSLSQATKFSAYVPQSSLSISRLETLCWMVQHGDLQSRPRELHTLYHGKGGEVNAWENFIFCSDQEETSGPSRADKPAEWSIVQEPISIAEGQGVPSESASAKGPSSGEKQATVTEVQEQAVLQSVEKDNQPKASQQNEARAEERQGSIPPTYQEAVSPPPPAASAATAHPAPRAAQSFSIAPTNTPPERRRQWSAPPVFRRSSEGRHSASTSLQPLSELESPIAVSKGQASSEIVDQIAPPAYKRTKPPSDDELGDDDLETAATSTKDRKAQKSRLKSKTASKAPRPSKQVRFDNTSTTTRHNHRSSSTTTTAAASPPPSSSFPPPQPLPSALTTAGDGSSSSSSLTALAGALPKPQATLLRQTIDWFKWAWTTDRRAHVGLTHPHLRELGSCARAGDVAGFYRVRARCSARVVYAGVRQRGEGGENSSSQQLLEELEQFLLWMAEVAPEAEMALTGELRELGRLAREGDAAWLEHGQAVCAGFVLFWFGRVEEGTNA